MPSAPNSEFRHSQRTDEGPFAALLPLDELGTPASISGEISEVAVYYSDTPVPAGTVIGEKPWIRIMLISLHWITIWPVHQRADHPGYGKPLSDTIVDLHIAQRVGETYELPTTIEQLDDFLQILPIGFYKNWRYGLGLKWELRSIIATIAEIPGISSICFHAPAALENTDRVQPPVYCLGMNSYHRLRKEISATTTRHQRAARKEKAAICHNRLLHRVIPQQFDAQRLSLAPNTLADLTAGAHGQITLTKRDQRAAVTLIRKHADALAKSEPAALLRLKQDIELVTLGELIERCKALLAPSTTEAKWQSFLSANPFVLTMAFHYPVFKIGDQPYVGGKLHTGQGGSYSDFLMAAAVTNNLALIEIKRPGSSLLGKEYRGIYPPSTELSSAVAQIVAQSAEFKANFKYVGTELDRNGYQPHSVACVLIIGRKPTDEAHAKGFEQYRHSLHGVIVVTFDELVERLQSLYNLLTPSPTPKNHIPDEDIPF